MGIDRRSLLLGAGAALAAPRLVRAQDEPAPDVVASACRESTGAYSAVAYAEDGVVRRRVPLPARGHDLIQRPGTRECVVFARRPGRFAIAFSIDGSRSPIEFHSRPDRHFFGHGAFTRDGRLLLTSENDYEAARGLIGVRDATAGYRQIGEFDASGMEPHDLCLLSDGRTLVIANGGLETHPSSARENLNVATMEPSLIYLDIRSGDVLEVHKLPPDLHKLSIRHLALARGDLVCFGCQHHGPPGENPALVGFHRRGDKLTLLDAPSRAFRPMQNYVGSVTADSSGELIAASSPRGGLTLIIDAAARRIVDRRELKDVCGVAPRHEGHSFLMTSGLGTAEVWMQERDLLRAPAHRESFAWDNHAILVSSG